MIDDYIAECFLKIAEGLSHKSNFIRYTYREEMVMDAVENCLKAIENYNLDVVLVEAGKVGWGASSRNAGFCCLPPSKMSYKKMQSVYGTEETKKFFKNSVEGANYTKELIDNCNIDCDVTGENNFVVAHHKNKFDQIKEQAEV